MLSHIVLGLLSILPFSSPSDSFLEGRADNEGSLFLDDDNKNSIMDFPIDQTAQLQLPSTSVDQITSSFSDSKTDPFASDTESLFTTDQNGGDVGGNGILIDNKNSNPFSFGNDLFQEDDDDPFDVANCALLANLPDTGKSRVRRQGSPDGSSSPSLLAGAMCENPVNSHLPIGGDATSGGSGGSTPLDWNRDTVESLLRTTGNTDFNSRCSMASFLLLPIGVCSSGVLTDVVKMEGEPFSVPPRTFDQYTLRHYTIGMYIQSVLVPQCLSYPKTITFLSYKYLVAICIPPSLINLINIFSFIHPLIAFLFDTENR